MFVIFISSFLSYTVVYASSFNASFDGNGHTSGTAPSSITFGKNEFITIPSQNTLLKTNYIFEGWNTHKNGNGTTYSVGQLVNLGNGNTNLYAKWTLIQTYSVTFNGNGNTSGSPPINATWTTGQNVALPSQNTLQKTGFAFSGWNTNSAGTGTTYQVNQIVNFGSVNTTLYAKWTAIPSQVTGLTILSKTYDSLNITWSPINTATKYEVYVNGAFKMTVNSNNATIDGLTANSIYLISVKGVNGTVAGPASIELFAVTSLPTVTGLSLINKTDTSVSLSWNLIPGAEQYEVYLNNALKTTVSSTTTSITGLTANNSYTFSILATNNITAGNHSVALAVVTNLTAVTGLISPSQTETSITLNWNTIAGATEYAIYLNNILKTTVSSANATLNGLSAGTTYSVTVCALNNQTSGIMSTPLNVKTISIFINQVTIDAIANSNYKLALVVENIPAIQNETFILTYEPAVLTLNNFAVQADLTAVNTGPISGTNLQIISHSNGILKFKYNQSSSGQYFSGVLSIVSFIANSSGNTTIVLEMQ